MLRQARSYGEQSATPSKMDDERARSMSKCIVASHLPQELRDAIVGKLQTQETLLHDGELTKGAVFDLAKPVLLSHQVFTAAEPTLPVLKATDAACCVWKPCERSGVLQRCPSRLSEELRLERCRPRAVFEIQDLDVDVSSDGAALLNGFDIFDEGAVLSLGAPYHVEDYCLQNITTLQQSHKNASDACKVWFIVTDPVKGQHLRRAQHHSVCAALVESADYVLVQ